MVIMKLTISIKASAAVAAAMLTTAKTTISNKNNTSFEPQRVQSTLVIKSTIIHSDMKL